MNRRFVVGGAGLAVFLAVACSKRDPAPAPAPADDQALTARDKSRLAKLVEADVKVSHAMRDADEAAKTGDAGAAVAIVETRAAPAADEGLALASGSSMETSWGAQERDALSGLLRDRKAALPGYVEAVKSHDPEKMLGSIQAQAALERRAIKSAAEIDDKR